MARQLTKESKLLACSSQLTSTAGTFYTAPLIDTAGYQGCRFIAVIRSTAGSTGTIAWTIGGQNTTSTASTNFNAITGASVTVAVCATASALRIGSIEVAAPQYRYLRSKMVKKTKIIVQSVLAELYGPSESPANPSTYNRLKFAATTAVLSHVAVRAESTCT